MLRLVRKHPLFVLAAVSAGFALRLVFLFRFPAITNDSFVYGDIARNWMQHGIYGMTGADGVTPTLIRLPGYPAFLALIFSIFGMEHYRAVLFVQILVDLGTCFVIAEMALRMSGECAARAALLLAALCPFLANYAAAALTETLEIFLTALALLFALEGWDALTGVLPPRRSLLYWSAAGLCTSGTILLRPDGGILLGSIGLFLLVKAAQSGQEPNRRRLFTAAVALGVFALAPLIPWTLRNLRTFGEFQPLAPRYANAAGDFVPRGFHRWVKTWMIDYVSVEEIYWNVPGETVDAGLLPSRAFDSEAERRETMAAFDAYNRLPTMNPELDGRFEALAEKRIAHSLLRYYLWLPALRIADMWLRPRTELLPSDTRWWEFNDDPMGIAMAVSLGTLGLAYAGAAILGLVRRPRPPALQMLLWFLVLRSLFLTTLENPEPRYTLECYPVVILLIARLWGHASGKEPRSS